MATSEKNILIASCKKDFWNKTKNVLVKDMFPGELGMLYDTIVAAHQDYDGDVTIEQVEALFHDRYPATPSTTKKEIGEVVEGLVAMKEVNPDVGIALVEGLWKRYKAKMIGEAAIDIYLGKEEDFGEIAVLLEQAAVENIFTKHDGFEEVTEDLDDMINALSNEPEFRFPEPLHSVVPGLDRGHFGIVFARPEKGKTTFCAYMAAEYLKQGHTVVYFGNEEPAIRTKIRVACAYLDKSVAEIKGNLEDNKAQWDKDKHNLKVFDAVAVDIDDINSYVELNRPDVVFVDQMDKMRIGGTFNRTDEKLKEIYVRGREIAKRNKCLVWAVSQASYDAHNKAYLDYSMLDNSKTGKGGEADIIIGIGSNTDEEDLTRHLTASKNKINGWHGHVHSIIDPERGTYRP